MSEQNSLFRSKNMDSISSPEKMDDYIHATTPAGWMIISVIILVLIVFFIASVAVSVDSKLDYYGIKEDENLILYVPDFQIDIVKNQENCVVNDVKKQIIEIGSVPIQANEINGYVCELNSYTADSWIYQVVVNGNGLENGIHKVEFIGESIRPIEYLIN